MKLFMYKGRYKNVCGPKIRAARKMQQLNQTELAKLAEKYGVNVDQKAISRIELQLRIVTDYELMVFANILQIPLVDLLEAR